VQAAMMPFKAFEVNIAQPCGVLTYDLGAAFFKCFENSLLEKGKLTATVRVDKTYSYIRLFFAIVGTITLACDRSLEEFDYPVNVEKAVTFRLGRENKELTEDLYMIEQNIATINIAQHLYDFVSLAVPMKKLHPRFFNNDDA